MAQKIEEARVRQKADTLENWNNNDLPLLDGEQAFIRSDVDDMNIGFKLGSKNKKFSELPYPDYSVRGKVSPSSTWTGRQSGVYIPTLNGTYNGITVNLGEGYQVLFWDGETLEKVVYPADFTGLVFGGVIDDSYDLSNPTEPIWYIASAGTYNTDPETTLTEQSILTWNSTEWSHVPFELEVRGEFLVADNVEELRNITPQVASLLTNGTYKGVTLLGYYEKGDTPAPIEYYLSDTTAEDDGGSVFEVGGIKLEHTFLEYTDVKYFGAIPNTGISSILNSIIRDDITIDINEEYLIESTIPIIDKYNVKINSSTGSGILKINSAKQILDISNSNSVSINGIKVLADTSSNYLVGAIRIRDNSTNINIGDNVFEKVSQAVWVHDCDYVWVKSNVFSRCGYGILQQSGTYANNVFIDKNVFQDYYRDCIEANSASVLTQNWSVTNNICTGGASYPLPSGNVEGRFLGATNIMNLTIIGNIIERTTGDNAIHIEGWCKNCIIMGNTFDNCINGTNQIGQSPYIHIHALDTNQYDRKYIIVSNNSFSRSDVSLGAAYCFGQTHSNSCSVTYSNNIVRGTNKNLSGLYGYFSQGRLSISLNQFIDCFYGIDLRQTSSNIPILSNYFDNCDTPILLANPQNLDISHNNFINTVGIYDISCDTNSGNANLYRDGNKVAFNFFSKTIVCRDASNSKVIGNTFKQISDNQWGRSGTSLSRGGNLYKDNNYGGFWIDNHFGRVGDIRKIFSGRGIPEGNGIPQGDNSYLNVTSGFIVGDRILNTTIGYTNRGWICIQSGDFNTAVWVEFGGDATTTNKGLVNQAATSPDSSTSPSATYTQSEVQAILTELRDLKTKLRNAGILAT